MDTRIWSQRRDALLAAYFAAILFSLGISQAVTAEDTYFLLTADETSDAVVTADQTGTTFTIVTTGAVDGYDNCVVTPDDYAGDYGTADQTIAIVTADETSDALDGYDDCVLASDDLAGDYNERVVSCDGDSCGEDYAGGCDDSGCGSRVSYPPWVHRSSVWGEFLYLHPTGVDMAHAQQQNGIGGAGTTPFGRIGTDDPTYQPGFRVGSNWALDKSSSIAGSYTFYESQARDTVVPGAGGSVGSLVHHPGAAITASAGTVNSTYDIDFQLADLEYRRLLFGSDRNWMNYRIGVLYGHLEQDFSQTGVFSGGSAGTIDTRTDIDFDGGGVKLGLDGERLIGCRGFSFYGRASVSPIVGQFSSDYTMLNSTTSVLLANAVWKDDRFVTILDYEFGLAWTGPRNRWRFSGGYMASFWFNAVTTPSFIDAVQADNYVGVSDTISFDGFTTRLEYRF